MSSPPKTRRILKGLIAPEGLVWIILAALIVVSIFASDLFLRPNNLQNVFLVQPVGRGLAALGQAMIVIAGGIDLSVGSMISLLTSLAAGIFQQHPGLSPILIVLLLVALGAAMGAINGFIVVYMRVAPFMATLAMMLVYQGMALFYAKRTMGGVPKGFRVIADGDILGIPLPIILFICVIVFCWLLLGKTRFGKHLYAVGADSTVSALSGINVKRTRFLAYLLGGILFSLSAIFLTARMGGGGPKVGVGYELDSITAIVIGGVALSGGAGNVFGAFGGVLIIGVFYNLMNLLSMNSFLQTLLKGLVLILAVAFTFKKKK